MKKILLLPLLMMCGVIAVNAQLQSKLRNWSSKEKMEMIEMAKKPLSSIQKTQLEMPVMKTRGNIEDYISNPYWLTNNNISKDIVHGTLGPANTMDVATYYIPSVTERFSGNKITKIYTVIGDQADRATMWIRKSLRGENLWEKTLTTFNTYEVITVDCDYTMDGEAIIVGYTLEGNITEGAVFFTKDFNTPLSLLAGQNGEWYDVSSNGSAFFVCATEGEAGLKKNDATLSQLSYVDRTMVGSEYYAFANYINFGYYPILSVKAKVTIGKDEYIEELPVDTVPFLGAFQIGVPVVSPAQEGRHECSVEIIEVNGEADGYPADNGSACYLIALNESYPRKVVMEEFTGSWCGWCPRGAVAIENLKRDFPNDFIGIAVHGPEGSADPNVSETYAPLLDEAPGFPAALMNRITVVDPYHGLGNKDYGIKDIAEYIMVLPTEAQMGVSSTLSEDKSEIEITSYTRFNVSLPDAPYYVAYAFMEDKIKGSQTNYYSYELASQTGYTEADLPDDLKPLYQKKSTYGTIFNDVAREIYDVYGIEGSLSGSIQKGELKQHTYTIPVPSSIRNLGNTTVIAMLLDAYTGEIIAAEKAKVGEATLTGIETLSNSSMNADVKAIPGELIITASNATASVYTIDGKLIASRYVNGTASISTNGLNGTVIVKIEDGKDAFVKKFTL